MTSVHESATYDASENSEQCGEALFLFGIVDGEPRLPSLSIRILYHHFSLLPKFCITAVYGLQMAEDTAIVKTI